jgi:hypothetical protein
MYVIVNHEIVDAGKFWQAAQSLVPSLPANVKLHHSYPSADGRKAVCVWEAESVDTVRELLDPMTEGMARNEYYQAPNKEGVSLPSL